MKFFWYQTRGGSEEWLVAPADSRPSLVASLKPAFVTVLDASDVPEEGWTKEQYLDMRYTGPFYLDWDGESIEEVIPDFITTLEKLKEDGLDLDAVRIYATGGRGFHIEIPIECIVSKPNPKGYLQLPQIYRGMAQELVTDTLDMRVYSSRRGRMWRTPNVQRDNGKFKVRISTEEALEMTTDMYEKVTSDTRADLPPAEPTVCHALQALFLKHERSVDRLVRARKRAKDESKELKKFGGKAPPAVEMIASGTGYDPDKGFNQIAMQLAIVYTSLGFEQEQFIETCDGFIRNHKGDGQRYGSVRRRREAMREMFAYIDGNDLYSYSSAAIKAICSEDVEAKDVTGETDLPYDPEIDNTSAEDLLDDPEARLSATRKYKGLRITRKGAVNKSGDGNEDVLTDALFVNVRSVRDPVTHKHLGFSAQILADRHTHEHQYVPLEAFNSRSSLDRFTSQFGSSYVGTDSQASHIRQMLSERARANNALTYGTTREGMDLLAVPHKTETFQAWVSTAGTYSHSTFAEDNGIEYVYRPLLANSATFRSDLLDAKELEGTDAEREWLRLMLKINSRKVIGPMLAWFAACFLRRLLHDAFKGFPLLHPVGQAGSGKTQTTTLFARMFYNEAEPVVMSAGISSTNFSIKCAVVASSSIPLILDEYKPAEMQPGRHGFLMTTLRQLYNGTGVSSGGVSDGSAAGSYKDVTYIPAFTPVAYIAEAMEGQTAMCERSVVVNFSKATTRAEEWEAVMAQPEYFSKMGRSLLEKALDISHEQAVKSAREHEKALKPIFRELLPGIEGRLIQNAAILMVGMDLVESVLKEKFDTDFDDELTELRQAIVENATGPGAKATPEYVSALIAMSINSNDSSIEESVRLREGYEYVYTEDGQYIEFAMRELYMRYRTWAAKTSNMVNYATMPSFIEAFRNQPELVVDTECTASPFKQSQTRIVFRLSVKHMQDEGIPPFRSKLLGLGTN